MMQQTNKYALCKFSKTVSTTATCKSTSYSTVLIEQIEVKVKITLYRKIVGESKETSKLIDSGGREAMVKIVRESKGNDRRRELGYRRRRREMRISSIA
jgi:ribosomal protein L21